MITYTKEEIIPSTSVSRNFGDILNKLTKHKLSKVAVIRNNKIEAVILPIETYENISNNLELSEYLELSKLIKERESTESTVDLETVLTEMGITLDEL
ncbi:MAG: hypothetical protein WCR42_06865 [bacterium]